MCSGAAGCPDLNGFLLRWAKSHIILCFIVVAAVAQTFQISIGLMRRRHGSEVIYE
jgi:hypothetical protein